MKESAYQKIVQRLELLREIELALGEFYGRCSFCFPEDEHLWEELKSDEFKHAEQIKELATMVTEKKEKFLPGEFNLVALKTYLNGIEDQRDRLEKGELTRDNTLYIAQDYENTLVEKQFYRAVVSNDPEFLHLTEKIEQEEREHLKKLSDYLKSIVID